MEFQQLRYFVMCAKHLSFSKVAELSFTSQPSVSKAISAMEAEIGAELFRRSSRNMAITQIGEELLPFAEAILEQEDQMKGFLHQRRTGLMGKPLIIGVARMLMNTPNNYLLGAVANTVEKYNELNPGDDVKIRLFDEEELMDMLKMEKIDVAILCTNSTSIGKQLAPKTDFLRLNETKNYLVYSPAVGEVSSIEELLSKVDCILTVKDQVAVQSTYAFTRLYPAPLPVKVCDNYGEAIIRLKNGQGVAVLNADSADIALQCRLKYFSLEHTRISSCILAVWRSESDKKVIDFSNLLQNYVCK